MLVTATALKKNEKNYAPAQVCVIPGNHPGVPLAGGHRARSADSDRRKEEVGAPNVTSTAPG